MALIKCLKCGNNYSDKIAKCPHCEYEPSFFVCPECNLIYHKDEEKCSSCGVSFENISKIPANDELVKNALDQLINQANSSHDSKTCFEILKKISKFDSEVNITDIHDDLLEKANKLKEEEEKEQLYAESKENFCGVDDIFLKMEAYKFFKNNQDYKDVAEILEQGETEFLEDAYVKGKELLDVASTDEDYDRLYQFFDDMKDYNDSETLKNECLIRKQEKNKKIERKRKTRIGIIAATIAFAFSLTAGYLYLNPKEARDVRKQISEISEAEITTKSKTDLDAIKLAYTKLDERGKKAVKNYSDLEEAFEKYYKIAAQDFDSRVKDETSLGEDGDVDTLKSLYNEYDRFDQNVKSKIKTYDSLKSGLCDAVIGKICSYDCNSYEDMRVLYVDYKAFLLENGKLEKAALHIGKYLSYEVMKKELRSRLKDPNSLRVSTYNLSEPVADKKNNNYYDVYTSCNYSATNSFGAYVSGYAYANVHFTVNTDDGGVRAVVDYFYSD